MNKKIQARLVWVIIFVLIALVAVWYQVAGTHTAMAATAGPLTVENELKQLVDKVNAKLSTGARGEEALAEELKSFDALLAAHKNEQTDEVANVPFAKAMIYAEVLEEFEKAQAILVAIKKDFPKTKFAEKADALLPQLAPLIEMQKIQATLKPGVVLPDFEGRDLAGESISIARFRGKIVLVDLWATWCPPCLAELPGVQAAYKKYHDKGFEVLGISLDRDEDVLKKFVADRGMAWPQYSDKEGALLSKYGFMGIPATFLLDREGKIIAKQLRGPALEEELEKIFGK